MPQQAPLPVELSASYAHRVGGDVHVVLQLAEDVALGSAPRLQLRSGQIVQRVATTPGTATPTGGPVVEARVPSGDLRPGVWHLGLVDGAADAVGVEARLLTSDTQPVALLPGPVPRTEMAPPRPRRRENSSAARQRAYQAAARVANKGLSLLPEGQAAKYRSALKRAGRKVLS